MGLNHEKKMPIRLLICFVVFCVSCREYRHKKNITFHSNHTVSFLGYRTFIFQPDRSNGSENDYIVMPNILVLVSGLPSLGIFKPSSHTTTGVHSGLLCRGAQFFTAVVFPFWASSSNTFLQKDVLTLLFIKSDEAVLSHWLDYIALLHYFFF